MFSVHVNDVYQYAGIYVCNTVHRYGSQIPSGNVLYRASFNSSIVTECSFLHTNYMYRVLLATRSFCPLPLLERFRLPVKLF